MADMSQPPVEFAHLFLSPSARTGAGSRLSAQPGVSAVRPSNLRAFGEVWDEWRPGLHADVGEGDGTHRSFPFGTVWRIGLLDTERRGYNFLVIPRLACSAGHGGAIFCVVPAAARVVVFLDYQNVYHLGRAAFGYEGDPDRNIGHVHPVRVGELLCELGRSEFPDRVLGGVRVYRGLPDIRSGANLLRFTSRQLAAWERTEGVTVRTRPLAYYETTAKRGGAKWRAQEKGVDVMLAVDLVDMARTDSYDTAVVFSADSDLSPALEAVVGIGKRVETATWQGPVVNRGPLRTKERSLWNHYLNQTHFDLVRDHTDYLAAP